MTPKSLALMTVALWCLTVPQAALAAAPSACGVVPDFVPVRSGGVGSSYLDSLYSIGTNVAYSQRQCGPVVTAQKKSALLMVPPNPQPVAAKSTMVAAVVPEAEIEPELIESDLPAPVPEVVTLVKPVPRPAVVEAPPPAPVPAPSQNPVQVQAELPAEVPDEEASYSEPLPVAPVVIGLGTAAVVTYAIWDTLNEKDGEPARLTAGTEPVQALAAYDTNMLASFAAVNTVADLQSDQQVSWGVSSSVYDDTPAFAAGMSLRLGTQGIFKTAISFSDSEYLANAGLSYGW